METTVVFWEFHHKTKAAWGNILFYGKNMFARWSGKCILWESRSVGVCIRMSDCIYLAQWQLWLPPADTQLRNKQQVMIVRTKVKLFKIPSHSLPFWYCVEICISIVFAAKKAYCMFLSLVKRNIIYNIMRHFGQRTTGPPPLKCESASMTL